MRWQDWAACEGLGWDLFYPPDGLRGEAREELENRAKAECARCVVRGECLENAMRRGDWHGVQGGLTGDERKRRYLAARKRAWNAQQTAARRAARQGVEALVS